MKIEYGFLTQVINKATQDLLAKRDKALIQDLIPKLRFYGLDVTEDNFLSFVPRLTRVETSHLHYDLYLDYQEGGPYYEQKFLVSYNEEINLTSEGNKFTATIG